MWRREGRATAHRRSEGGVSASGLGKAVDQSVELPVGHVCKERESHVPLVRIGPAKATAGFLTGLEELTQVLDDSRRWHDGHEETHALIVA